MHIAQTVSGRLATKQSINIIHTHIHTYQWNASPWISQETNTKEPAKAWNFNERINNEFIEWIGRQRIHIVNIIVVVVDIQTLHSLIGTHMHR